MLSTQPQRALLELCWSRQPPQPLDHGGKCVAPQAVLTATCCLCCRQQKVDVTITTMRSGVVRVEDAEESLYASIDLVADKIARKLKKVGWGCCLFCVPGGLKGEHCNKVAWKLKEGVLGHAVLCAHHRRLIPGGVHIFGKWSVPLWCVPLHAVEGGRVRLSLCARAHKLSSQAALCAAVCCCVFQVKDKLIAQGAWPGSGGPRVNTEDQDFKVNTCVRVFGREGQCMRE